MKRNGYTEFPCDVCLSKDAVEVPHSREYSRNEPIHICKQCGFVYVKLRRPPQKIADVWSKDIFQKGYTAHIPHVLARQTFVAGTLDNHVKLRGKSVCDIGAGEGQFLDIVRDRKYGASVFGIEPSEYNCKLLKSMSIPYFHGSMEAFLKSPERNNYRADVVTIMWTLENCQNPRGILKAAYGLLKEDGYIVLATGSRILVPFKKPLNMYISKNGADTHATHYSANSLRGILAESHFETTFINRYLDNDILCVIAKKRPLSKKIARETDNYLDVYNFFERWHADTQVYYKGR